MERACWWNWHVGGIGLLVEQASCLWSRFSSQGCWWNWHVGRTGILPVVKIFLTGMLVELACR
ncbi:hypothetical protein [Moorena sp. SIOASIH]|uniref:hypothetical protein n=1 Tax=Moorena sp. SIOASIH TaxID=2607817 RepID=UPI0025E01048|nr:hypothetical protein [Moorena sp. SIOASIH]